MVDNPASIRWKFYLLWVTGGTVVLCSVTMEKFKMPLSSQLPVEFLQDPFFGIGSDILSSRKIGSPLADPFFIYM